MFPETQHICLMFGCTRFALSVVGHWGCGVQLVEKQEVSDMKRDLLHSVQLLVLCANCFIGPVYSSSACKITQDKKKWWKWSLINSVPFRISWWKVNDSWLIIQCYYTCTGSLLHGLLHFFFVFWQPQVSFSSLNNQPNSAHMDLWRIKLSI